MEKERVWRTQIFPYSFRLYFVIAMDGSCTMYYCFNWFLLDFFIARYSLSICILNYWLYK
jgi:hypothetical protein